MQKKVKAVPQGYHTITPSLVIHNAKKAIQFYKKVFNAKLNFFQEWPDGKVMHAEMAIGDSIFMIADDCGESHTGHETKCVRSPSDLRGTTISLYLYVNNADAIFRKALKNKAKVVMPMEDMFWGDRMGTFKDPFGHFWSIATHVKNVLPKEMKKNMKDFVSKVYGD